MPTSPNAIHESADSSKPAPPRCVAVKVATPRFGHLASNEVTTLRSMDEEGAKCPHIVQLHDHFEYEERVCLVFEMHGQELMELLMDYEVDLPEAKQITRQLLLGLSQLHRVNIAHTDIKPQNVLYAEETEIAKLIDFSTSDRSYKKGRNIGTRAYRSPEVLLGNDWDTSVDVWALACSVFEVLTGDYLFDVYSKAEEVRAWYDPTTQRHVDEFRRLRREKRDRPVEEVPAEEVPEPFFTRGRVLNGRYALVSVLGEGSFSTVWKAVDLPEEYRKAAGEDYVGPAAFIREHASEYQRRTKPRASSIGCSPEWGEAYHRSTNLALFVLVQECLGDYPVELASGGQYYESFFNDEGKLHFDPVIERRTISQRLVQDYGYEDGDANAVEAFLLPMLAFDRSSRPTVEECLAHPWLAAD